MTDQRLSAESALGKRSSIDGALVDRDFEAFFSERIEPPIRLPQGMGTPSPRAHVFTLASLVCLSLSGGLWLLGVPWPFAGLPVVIAAGLILAAVQLRMGGHGMGLRDARDHVAQSMAAFLSLTPRTSFALDDLQAMLRPVGQIQPNSIMRLTDAMDGRVGSLKFTCVQVLGAVAPSREEPAWLGMPLALVTGRFTVDGLLVRFDLPVSTGVRLTVSNDRRLAHRDEPDCTVLELVEPGFGCHRFEEEFRIVCEASTAPYQPLTERVCTALADIATDLGPTTLHINGAQAYLSVWVVGDIYEISSLGSGLRGECRRVVAIMDTGAKLARVLMNAYGMD